MATYVMSDMHGLKDKFDKACDFFDYSKDHIYVLGDAIDRGKHGIEILQYIMQHQDNFTFLMGNHELMMLEYFNAKGTPNEDRYFMNWILNGCTNTLGAFNNLDEEQQNAVLSYLNSLPIAYTNVKVNDRTFYLVHGAPVKTDKEIVYYNDPEEKVYDYVWTRCEDCHEVEGKIVVFGHTMTMFYQEEVKPYKIWHNKDTLQESTIIDIDCGCAAKDDNSNLCVLRLDDLKEFYF